MYAKFPMAASITIFEGALVVLNASGNATNAVDTASHIFVGICTNTVTNGVTAGAVLVEVEYGHEELLTSSATLASVTGAPAVVTDNDSVTTVALGTNDIKVGVVTEFVSATRAWVGIRVAQTV